MGKRISRLIVLIVFGVGLTVAVLSMPHMATDTTHGLLDKATKNDEVDYDTMSEKELLVLAYDGDSEACYCLGKRYDYGINGTAQDFASAMDWYRAADAYGHTKAAAAMGYLYLNGCGVDKDVDQAVTYFSRAISLYDTEGYVGTGRAALEVLDSDPTAGERAFTNFSTADEKKDIDGTYFLGYLYEKGIGTEADIEKAIKYYNEVIESDSKDVEDKYAIHEAYTRLGLVALSGQSEELTEKDAINYIRTAADDGYSPAQYYMGVIYEQGSGVGKSFDEALSWLESAAQQNYAPALNEIGYMYFNGLGVDVDYEQAVYYQKLAAALGYEKAQLNLGYLYENGYGVEQNYETAKEYYEMANADGYPGAAEALTRIQTLIDKKAAEGDVATTEDTTANQTGDTEGNE